MTGGSLLALRGILKEQSSVTNVMLSSKSAKLGAQKETLSIRLMPGAMSPLSLLGYLAFRIVKLSLFKCEHSGNYYLVGGMNFILREMPEKLVTFRGISYTPFTW